MNIIYNEGMNTIFAEHLHTKSNKNKMYAASKKEEEGDDQLLFFFIWPK